MTFAAYDGLNRVVSKSYNDTPPTPTVAYTYGDTLTGCNNCKGRVASITAGNVIERYQSYDALGRITSHSEQIGNSVYPMRYQYDLAGELTGFTFPSRRQQTIAYDTAGRPSALTGSGNSTYAGSFTWFPNGSPQTVLVGPNQLLQQYCQNSLLQMTGVRLAGPGASATANCANTNSSTDLFNLALSYPVAGSNNGNLSGEGIQTAGGVSHLNIAQTFAYDAYNRLQTAREGAAWGQYYSYDAFGNRAVTNSGGITSYIPNPNATPTALTQYAGNRWNGTGTGYDAGGNLTAIPGSASITATYDGEGRVATVNAGGMGVVSYAYDGEGRRAQKTSSSFTTSYVYDASGNLVAEYGTQANAHLGTEYLTGDHLGNTRVVTDATGTILRRYDYLPFGEELPAGMDGRGSDYGSATYPTTPDVVSQKFTGKERDAESGLDFFGARYMLSAEGRFTSPDRYNAMLIRQNLDAANLPSEAATSYFNGFLENPQNWNQYAYVRNNPLRFTDPTGAAPQEGHHLIVSRDLLNNPLAKSFANAVRTGPLSGNGFPNQPGFGEMHRAYNAAVDEILDGLEETLGDRNTWSLSQWKAAANEILTSEEPAIREFLDELEKNNPGALRALAAASASYRIPPIVAARAVAANLLSDFLRLPFIVVIEPVLRQHMKEEIKKSHRNCLIDRTSGKCAID